MTPKLATLIFFLFAFVSKGQTNYSEASTLNSVGPMPQNLRKHYYFGQFERSQTPYLKMGRTRDYEIKSIFDAFIRSGLIVYGDETQQLCQEITNELVASDDSLNTSFNTYVIKTNFLGLLNNRDKEIYVPSGTIAKLTEIEQLYFLIAREIYFLKNRIPSIRIKMNRTLDQTTKFRALSNFESSEVLKADSYAYRRLTALNLNTTKGIYALDKLDVGSWTFEEEFISPSVLVHEIEIPSYYSDLSKHRFGTGGVTPYLQSLISRRKSLQTTEPLALFSNSDLTLKFPHVRTLCQLQGIEDYLLDNDPYHAMYTVYTLEKRLGRTPYLTRMKALCWVTLTQLTSSYSLSRLGYKFYIVDCPSAPFILTLYRMNHEEIMWMTLKNLIDLSKEQPEYATELSGLFQAVVAQQKEINPTQVGEYFSAIQANKAFDFVPGTPLSTRLFSNLNTTAEYSAWLQIDTVKQAKSTVFVYPEVTVFKRQTYYLGKSETRRKYVYESLEKYKFNYISVDSIQDTLQLTELYNTKNYFLRIQSQQLRQTAQRYTVVPLNYYALNTLAKKHQVTQIGTLSFENQYNLNPQGYHLLAFFAIPLPFLFSDYFLGANHTRFFAYVYDTETEKLVLFKNQRYRDPLKRAFISNKTYQTLKPLINAK